MSRAIRTVRWSVLGLGAAAALLLSSTAAQADGPVPSAAPVPGKPAVSAAPSAAPVPGKPAVSAVPSPVASDGAPAVGPVPGKAPDSGQVKVIPKGGAQTGEGTTGGPSTAELAGGSVLALIGLGGVGYAVRKRRVGAAN